MACKICRLMVIQKTVKDVYSATYVSLTVDVVYQ